MDLLDRLLGHDAWTTRLLLTRAMALPDADLDRQFDIGHRSIRATAEHVVSNMEVWSALMAGQTADSIRGRPRGDGTIANLIARLDAAADELQRIARGIADEARWDDTWLDTLDNPPTRKTYGGAIAHVITHSMHHRAQLLFLLRNLGVQDLPEGDVFSWEHRSIVL